MSAGEELDDNRLPWLETVEEDYREGPSALRIVLLILILLSLIGAAAFGWWWYQRSVTGDGTGALISAPEGPYKVRPDTPGGMKVEGEGDTVFAASEGVTISGSVDVSGVPEAPVDGKAAPKPSITPIQGAPVVVAPVPAPTAERAKPVAVRPVQRAPGPSAGSATLQLGSYPSQAAANAAWARLSKRFDYLAPLGKEVVAAEVDGKTFHRLRVNAGSNTHASELCGKLKAAGEACFLAGQ